MFTSAVLAIATWLIDRLTITVSLVLCREIRIIDLVPFYCSAHCQRPGITIIGIGEAKSESMCVCECDRLRGRAHERSPKAYEMEETL